MGSSKIKILAIDDDDDNLSLLKLLLKQAFPEGITLTAENGEKGIELAISENPDVVLLDLVMPDMDGYEVCKKIKSVKKLSDTPVVFITGLKIDNENRIRAVKSGADGFLSKPIELSALTAQIRAMVKNKNDNIKKREAAAQLVNIVEDRTRELRETHTATLNLLEDLKNENDARKKSEEALRENETKYRSVLQSATDAIISADSDGNIMVWNKGAERIFGYSYTEAVGQPLTFIMPPHHHAGHTNGMKRFQCEGNPHVIGKTVEVEGLRKDGSVFPLELSLSSWETLSGQYFTGIIRDISERKRAEETLQESQQRFQGLVETLSDWIWEVDPKGRYTYVSPRVKVILGYEPEDIIGKAPFELMSAEETQRVTGIFGPLMLQQKPIIELENICIHKDGHPVVLETSGVPFYDAHGNFAGYRGADRDITDRKRAAEELKKSEEKYRSIFENVQDVYYETSFDGTILEVSPSIESVSKGQYSQADLIGKSMYEIYSDTKDRDIIIAAMQKTGSVTDFEVRLRNRDGSSIPCSISSKIYYNAQGQPEKIIGSMHDISERKLAEQELRESKALIDAVVENVPHMVFLKEAKDLRFVVFNRAGEELLGYDRTALLGKNNLDLFPSEQAAHFMAKDREVLDGESGMLDIPEEPILTAKKGQRLLHTRKVCIRGADGITKYLLGISEDITERKLVEEALQESELRFRSLYENTTIGLYRTTPDGNILLANPALVKMLGYSSFQKLAERNLEKDGFEPAYQRKEFLEKIERDGEIIGYDSKWICQNGTTIFVLESARAIRDSDGKTMYYDGTVEDITRRRHLEEQMLHMQKLEEIGTLAGGIAHDFNNILGIILAYVTSVKWFREDTNKLDYAADTIIKAVERGKTLVRQILTFASKSETEFLPVDLNDVAREIMAMILETFPKIITYSQNLDKHLPLIQADRSQLYQLLLNLCVNARDAMPSGGVLTITTHRASSINLRNQYPDAVAGNYICIEVCDTGEGMTDEIRKRIFEPFFTTKEKGKGTGLGLAVVFGVIQTHKGFIDVESEPGKGTTFRAFLPSTLAAEPVGVEEGATIAYIPGGTETLLVVEDEEYLMEPLLAILFDKGYTVLPATNGLEAMDIYEEGQNQISLVLTDLGLPKMSGIDVCKRIKQLNPDARIIVATGFLDPEMKTELLDVGLQHFLYKPYNPRDILKIVRKVLDEK